MRMIVLFVAWMCAGCQTWHDLFPKDEAESEEPKAELEVKAAPSPTKALPAVKGTHLPPIEASPSNDMELRLAKLWARVDEMENQQIEQKERMKLLEKGLMLGIVPEELKHPSKRKSAKPAKKDDWDEADELTSAKEAAPEEAPKVATPPPPAERSKDMAAYRQKLQAAQEKFNAAQYGQAIVHFNEISSGFDDSITEGSQHYWIGLSWYYLKEYQLAEQSFKALVEQYASNSWVPHARFYRAKIDQSRGMNQRALTQFQQLMEDFANQDLGEMARMEVARMKDKL